MYIKEIISTWLKENKYNGIASDVCLCSLIISTWLKENGYDGMCSEDCFCALDDLFHCGEYHLHCEAAYRLTNGEWWSIKQEEWDKLYLPKDIPK